MQHVADEEYRLTRANCVGEDGIAVSVPDDGGPPEVVADPELPHWYVDAVVRYTLISRGFLGNDAASGDDPS